MKIIKIISKKKNEYEIELEKGKPFLIFDETILKYNLNIGKALSNTDLKNINNYNTLMKEYFTCLKKIKNKLKTEKEIITYLNSKNISIEDIQIIIEKLKKSNSINDNRYIESFINDKINLTLIGPIKIKKELIQKGFEENEINQILNKIDEDLWKEKINKFINKKAKENKKLSGKELKYKINNDLFYLGYPKELFNDNLNELNIKNDLNILEKEYQKLIKKYFKKINDLEKINLKIKYDLTYKGYNEEEINDVINKE